MATINLSGADASAIKSILEQWRDEGVANPLLPMDVDLNGDGVVDSFGLGADGELILVKSKLTETVYESNGDDYPLGVTEND